MLNIHDLEQRWIKYKIKSILPLFFSALAIITLGILFVYYRPLLNVQDQANEVIAKTEVHNTFQQPKTEIIDIESKNEVESEVQIDVPQNIQVDTTIHDETPLVLKPSLGFMDNIEENLDPYEQDAYQEPQDIPIPENIPQTKPEKTFVENIKNDTPKDEENKLTLTITSEKNDDDLKDVIRRFKKNKNPALSLFIAKHYYKAGNYQKSYNYALMTNEIDKTIEESWIIFAKSLVKLGQQELAMNTLKSYLKTTKSSAADVLLKKIESGGFK